MLIEETVDAIVLAGNGYALHIPRRTPVADLALGGRPIVALRLASALDAMDAPDEETWLDPPELARTPGGARLTWRGHSRRWTHKAVELEVTDGGFSYGYTVVGQGAIDAAYFFRTGAVASGVPAGRMFNPAPNSGAVRYTGDRCTPGKHCRMCLPNPATGAIDYTGPLDYMTISVGRDKEYHEGNWFFTPAPFCYALEGDSCWLALGVDVSPGGWTFTDMEYPGGGFGFRLRYDGHTAVDGTWRSPRLRALVAPDEYAAVEQYCDLLRAEGRVPARGRGPAPRWWREPMFCGWGEQVSQEVHWGLPKAGAWATQAHYTRWLATLAAHEIQPGTVVVDDKWQSLYGLNEVDRAKWPDLPGFIAGQHRQGRHVLLWLKAWDPEGVPAEECIRNAGGAPVTVDPGQPDFRARLTAQVTRMLREWDADGFKIDFTHLIPRGPRAGTGGNAVWTAPRGSTFAEVAEFRRPLEASAGGAWGLELLRQWLAIIADAARAAKPDALIIAHTANPYLADLVDMLRLNDVAGLDDIRGSIIPDMQHRARIARAASPAWLLDSDDWPCLTRDQWREYLQAQASGTVGVPALYHAERLGWGPTDEPLTDEDYAAVRAAWAAYRARLPAPTPHTAGHRTVTPILTPASERTGT